MLKKWSNKRDSSNDLNLSNRNTYDDGEENTNLILNYFNNVEDISPAAKYCNDLSVQGYDDWYLPSQKEIQKAATFLWSITSGPNSIRNIGSGIFWSSNTDSVINQRAQCSCVNGCNGSTNPPEYYKDSEIYVVAVRKF